MSACVWSFRSVYIAVFFFVVFCPCVSKLHACKHHVRPQVETAQQVVSEVSNTKDTLTFHSEGESCTNFGNFASNPLSFECYLNLC